jgi:hypothetical protein
MKGPPREGHNRIAWRQGYTVAHEESRVLRLNGCGIAPSTAEGKPLIIDVVVEFGDERRAVAFDKYLKSGSACVFEKRHLR